MLHLPAVHDFFNRSATELAAASNLEGEIAMVKSASYMWLLSGLTANLQHHMTYTCKVRKYGTLIYRPNTDLIPSLQKAMWSLCQSQVSKVELNAQSETVIQDSTQRSSRAVLDDLNSQGW